MQSERWQQIENIFHASQQFEPAERGVYLDRVCAKDADLRVEVESLLSAAGSAPEFLETPADAKALVVLSQAEFGPTLGKTFGSYRILSRLGAGGMGEVYLAEDSKLERNVALKLLPIRYNTDEEFVVRFQQEAKSASSLNHPNIITIHEVGEAEGRYFIATEFIEGKTLRQRIQGASLNKAESVKIVIQVARALHAAHAAGVLHRDIKPENIMIRTDGLVKVLDFGLARQQSNTLAGKAWVNTSPGSIQGTLSYMSPEQIRGLAVDQRSDIWSLTVVLYEMLTGGRPIRADTEADLLASIISDRAVPIPSDLEMGTIGLERILRKGLCKQAESRYQTVTDFNEDLTQLTGYEQNASFPLPITSSIHPVQNQTGPTEIALQTSTIHRLTSFVRVLPRLRMIFIALFLTVLIAITGSLVLSEYKSHTLAAKTQPFKTIKTSKLTNSGAKQPGISPDGKYVAFVMLCENGEECVWLRDVNTGNSSLLLPASGNIYMGLAFAHDGRSIYYNQKKLNEVTEYYSADLYQIPLTGGTPRKISADASGATLSPDGQQLAFIRQIPGRQENALIIINADGSKERVVAVKKWPELSWSPSWSPDGKLIAYGVRNRDGDKFYNTIMAVPVAGGSEMLLTQERWTDVAAPIVWLGDGANLAFAAKTQLNDPFQIYLLSYPEGEVRRITNDANGYSVFGVTSDSKTLVAQITDFSSDIWVLSDGDPGHAQRISAGGKDGIGGFSWTRDGRIVYASLARDSAWVTTATQSNEIWIVDSDGRNKKQLTFTSGINTNPSVTRDGQHVVFSSYRGGEWGIWTMDIDGRRENQIFRGGRPSYPTSSPDGKWVVFKLLGESGPPQLWKVPFSGGAAVKLNDQYAYAPSVSPDGKLIAFFSAAEKKNRIVVISSEQGKEVKAFEPAAIAPDFEFFAQIARWSPDGHAITYIDSKGTVSNIWGQPIAGGPPRQLTKFTSEGIFSFDWSPDGKSLALARGQKNFQIVLLHDIGN